MRQCLIHIYTYIYIPLTRGYITTPGVRPITLFEAPLKLATGVVLESQKARTVKALVPHQFGAMLSCGAEQMVHILRTLSTQYDPNSVVFASTDAKNTFGNASRSLVIDSVCQQMPSFAHIIRPLWSHQPSILHMPAGQQLFESFDVVDGMFQGECLSSAFFASSFTPPSPPFRFRLAINLTSPISPYISSLTLMMRLFVVPVPISPRFGNCGSTPLLPSAYLWYQRNVARGFREQFYARKKFTLLPLSLCVASPSLGQQVSSPGTFLHLPYCLTPSLLRLRLSCSAPMQT